jgi:hypothetical protein
LVSNGIRGLKQGGFVFLNIELYKDLIKDDRGNYYAAVHKEARQLTLVNAAVERSYRVLLEFTDEFKQKYAEYEHQFIGKIVRWR